MFHCMFYFTCDRFFSGFGDAITPSVAGRRKNTNHASVRVGSAQQQNRTGREMKAAARIEASASRAADRLD